MLIEIFEISLNSDGQPELDSEQYVGKVMIYGDELRVDCETAEQDETLRRKFDSDISVSSDGVDRHGRRYEMLKILPRLSDEAIFHLLRWVLPNEMGWCGVILESRLIAAPRRESEMSARVESADERIQTKTFVPQPSETTLVSFLKGDKYGFSDLSKNIRIAPEYDYPSRFIEDLALVCRSGKQVFIDKTGSEMFGRSFIFAKPFSEDLALVTVEGKQMFIDRAGRETLAFEPGKTGFGSFKNNLARVVRNTTRRIYFYEGSQVKPFSQMKHFSYEDPRDDAAGKIGFIDKTGRDVIECKYDSAEDFNEGLARVQFNGKWGFVDAAGNEVVAPQYDDALDFTNNLARVKRGGKYGYIDRTGREVIAPQYDVAAIFSENLAWVGTTGRLGYINTAGEQVIEPKYGAAGFFGGGLTSVWFDGKWRVIDREGRERFAPKYNFIDTFREGLAAVTLYGANNSLKGFIDTTGREVIAPKYKNAMRFEDGLVLVQLHDDKWIYADKNGTEFYEP